jgi:hypothetical protein
LIDTPRIASDGSAGKDRLPGSDEGSDAGRLDHLFEFGGSADKAYVTVTLHDPSIKVRDQRRLVVLMRTGKMIETSYADVGQQTPLKR